MSSSTPAPTTNSRRVPLDKRKRTETSCDKCKSRKQKCRKEPGQDACRYCMVHNIECLTTQPRKKRLYGSVEGLGTRLALLEALVKGLLPEADVSSTDALRQLATSHGIPLPESVAAQGDADHDDAADPDGDDTVSLLPDQQGQVQYIGPASSFAFHLKLRTLVGRGPLREFVLFGKNAASTSPDASDHLQHHHQHQHHHHALTNTPGSLDPATAAAAHLAPNQRPTLELLIRTFFDRIHQDIPVLHEPSFREAYDAWLADPRNADPAWLCTFTCMLLLARRVARVPFAEDQERLWWHRVQKLLPGVIFTSSVTAVQALILAAAHLHNTNHRDACWNLTGAAIRIAHAIGLHQDSVSAGSTPLARDTRRMLWWALYGFENMQVSSYDRPSAIEVAGGKLRYPSDKIMNCPPGLMAAYCRMWALLGTVCRAPRTLKPNSSDEAYVGPLSPAASALRDLSRWKETLPQHLQPEAIDATPPPCQRTLIMMHGLYHYTMIVLCRSALLARASTLSKTGTDSANPALIAMADACSESGRDLAQLLLKSDHLAKFDAVVNFDIWYMLASSSVLVLDLVCLNKLEGTDMSESRILLSQLADLAQRHRRNPYMPGTLEKFASLVPELHSMADSLASPVRISEPKAESHEPPPQPTLPTQPLTQPPAVPHMYHQSPPAAGTYMFADDMQSRGYPDQSYVGPAIHPTGRYDRNTQQHFMDFTINNINDWNWHDMSGLLDDGVSGVPNIPGNPHVHGSQSTGPN